MERTRTTCCIAGGGPAGLMLGLLLARAGVETVVLEKHADFLRDFRGDTIHPSTMTVMHELGLLEEFLKLPHQKVFDLNATFADGPIRIASFERLDAPAPYIAMMPQWDFLTFLAAHARKYPTFKLMMETEATGVVQDDRGIAGVYARKYGTAGEPQIEIAADLVVAADGRSSALRDAVGLVPIDFGAPMDALWFRLPRHSDDTDQTQGRFGSGHIFVMLNRGDYWQCAYVIAKGDGAAVVARGIDAFRSDLARVLPFANATVRAQEIATMDQLKLLTVQVNRLERWWKPGFLAIGDAAHAMSPVGGVGVNLAVQDAVAAANRLARPLRERTMSDADLAAVEARRRFPTRFTQRLQVAMQNTIIRPALATAGPLNAPLAARLLAAVPMLRAIPARVMGLGVRPEHLGPDLLQPWPDQA